jgi:hypothetical protein
MFLILTSGVMPLFAQRWIFSEGQSTMAPCFWVLGWGRNGVESGEEFGNNAFSLLCQIH